MDINRGAIVVRAKKPFLDWANSLDDSFDDLTLEELHSDSSVYLLPCWEEDSEFEKILRKACKMIFENELEGWNTDESLWPKNRGFSTFLKWMEVEGHSVVFELGDGNIKFEE